MGGDPWVYDKIAHSNNNNNNNNKLIQLLYTGALHKAIQSGVGGEEWQNKATLIKNKICKLLGYPQFCFLQEKGAANSQLKKRKKARLHFNWIIGEGKLGAFASDVT